MNKRVIKLGAVALLALIVLMAGFAFALRGHSSGQQQNRNISGQNRDGSRNANPNGDMNSDTRDATAGQPNANHSGDANGGNANNSNSSNNPNEAR